MKELDVNYQLNQQLHSPLWSFREHFMSLFRCLSYFTLNASFLMVFSFKVPLIYCMRNTYLTTNRLSDICRQYIVEHLAVKQYDIFC